MSQISRSDRYGDLIKNTARKMSQRRLSHFDDMGTIKKMNFTLSGNGKQISEFGSSTDRKMDVKRIEPFKIKDFIPQINSHIKGQLSKQNKQNFLDFLLIQKAGKAGDQKFFDSLIQNYRFDPFKKTLKPKNDQRQSINYLQKKEEREEQIVQQVQHFYKQMNHKRSQSDQPLDKMIIENNTFVIQKLPRFRAKLEALQNSNSNQK